MSHSIPKYVARALAGLLLAGCGMDAEPESPLTAEQSSQALTQLRGLAAYDTEFQAPACRSTGILCDTGSLIDGRGSASETHAPNTLFSSCADGTLGTYHSDESLDALRIYTQDGGPFLPGKTVTVDATIWAYTVFASDHLDLFYATDASNPQWTLLTTLEPTQANAQVLSTSFVLTAGADLQAIRAVMRYKSSAGACVTGDFSTYTDRDDLVFRLGDSPPEVTLTAPGSVLSGTAQLAAEASDDAQVDRVLFYAGSNYLGYDPLPPYGLNWNTTLIADGTYSLTARAVDTASHTTISAPITVVVDNHAPTVAFTAPSAGAVLSGSVNLAASASDLVGVTHVEFLSDGVLLGSVASAPYQLSWNTLGVPNGSHVITAKAYDAAGHSSQSQVSVSVSNDLPPTGVFTSPASGAVLSGTVALTVSAQDDVGMDQVNFYLGSQYITWDGKAPYSINFNTLNFINGDYTLIARIYDTAGHMTETSIPVRIQN
ncbi:Ig-like domain-containing protein [Hyalangium versicolor]|uniref:Ig-like domain-containing protein n=1 Tax=Hyalangium versicolor TaxID=2861190 RepID=UPI001CC97F67|nr:Ig-like domain-containing protein [Hyalangium versicolor]